MGFPLHSKAANWKAVCKGIRRFSLFFFFFFTDCKGQDQQVAVYRDLILLPLQVRGTLWANTCDPTFCTGWELNANTPHGRKHLSESFSRGQYRSFLPVSQTRCPPARTAVDTWCAPCRSEATAMVSVIFRASNERWSRNGERIAEGKISVLTGQ